MKGVQNMNKEKQKQEALARMKMLQIMPAVIRDFKNNNKVYYSERQNSYFLATLYWLDNHPEWVEMVKEFEAETGYMVYHAQLTYTEFGDLLSLFFVGEENEWEQEREDLANGQSCCKVINLNEPRFSEMGYIGIQPAMGGVTRTW